MKQLVQKIPFRASEWWNSKIASLCGLIYLFALANNIEVKTFLPTFLFLIIWMVFAASFGFYINDIFDVEKDAIAGKRNFAKLHSNLKRFSISVFLCLGIFLNWLFLSKSLAIGVLIIAQIFLFFLYSLPFIRLKEKPLLGIISDAVYAYVIPGWIILILTTGNTIGNSYILFMCYMAWLTTVGVRNIISHQLEDYENDRQTGTITSVTHYGYENVLRFLKIILPFFELSLLITFLCLQPEKLKYLALFYIIYVIYVVLRELKSDLWNNNQITIKHYNLLYNFFNEFYEKWLPPIMLILLSFKESVYFILLITHLIIFSKVATDFLTDYKVFKSFADSEVNQLYWGFQRLIGYLRSLFGRLPYFVWRLHFHADSIFWKIHKFLSLAVNYSLYYFFLLFNINLKNRAVKKQLTPSNQIDTKINSATSRTIEKPLFPDKSEKDAENKSSQPSNNLKISKELNEKNVHGLWIGNLLTNFELLTIFSFIEKGYTFHLWVYMPLQNKLPESVIICDANTIIPENKIFRYKEKSQFGTGKGSVAGFSDIFRYKLLYDVGGWWVDMDVTCLKPFDSDAPYFFRGHHSLPVVGSVMKVPKASDLMLKCYTQAIASVDSSNKDWHKPVEILVNNIRELKLEEYIITDISNKDIFSEIEIFLFTNTAIPDNWYFIHWCNEVFRTNYIPKNLMKYDSTVADLMRHYGIMPVLEGIEKQEYDRKVRMKLLERKFLVYL